MIYGRISAHNSQHRDNPSLWVPHLKGACPLRCSARDRELFLAFGAGGFSCRGAVGSECILRADKREWRLCEDVDVEQD
jgi:hypothetical protein